MSKEAKTNAMRLLDKQKIAYKVNLYTCDEFIDGVHVADQLGQSYDSSFKTLVTVGKSGEHYVFVLPIDRELDLKKAAKVVGEKSVEMIHVKDILALTGYVRGGCSPVGMKKRFRTLIDETCVLWDTIFISGGKRGYQLELAPDDLVAFCRATVAPITRED